MIVIAFPPGVTVRRITDELAQWMSASDGKLELSTEEVRASGAELIELRAEVAALRAEVAELRGSRSRGSAE